ncbi:porin [Burkholderia pseudomultivorans]|uniref:Porin n=1 Tax=Burkholderia pseudomultivorans TaxID=1207504 RepID=A0A132EVT2_9BURK|nr:porin [Burkholderia pseudomultivorans]KWF60924.1 porin [Burkholderia pseudomultivorans]
MRPVNRFAFQITLSTLCCAAAHAQSSVTLYGLLDGGVAYVSHAAAADGTSGSAFRFGNAMSGNRWGLKGSEELGGGLSAVFQLESGYSLGTGVAAQGGREFGRTAIVGLSSTRWGTIRMGRQYDPLVDLVSALTEDAYFGLTFGPPGDVDNYDGSMRVNNAIKYTSPLVGGVRLAALYGFGGVAGATSAGQTWSVAGSYAYGPFSVAAGYFSANGGNTMNGAGVRTWSASADSPFNTAANAGFASTHAVNIARIAAQYAAGAWTVGAGYSRTEYVPDGASAFHVRTRFNDGSAFANYRIGAALNAGIGYHYTWLAGASDAHYHQLNAGLDYLLSKRTDVYAIAAFQRASGTTLGAAGTPVVAQAVIGDYGLNAGANTQTIVAIGMRQRF